QERRKMRLQSGGDLVQFRRNQRPGKRNVKLKRAQHIRVAERFEEFLLFPGKPGVCAPVAVALIQRCPEDVEMRYAFLGKPIDISRLPAQHETEIRSEERRVGKECRS